MPRITPAYYLTFSGRISRSEYWLFFQLPVYVLNIIISVLLPPDRSIWIVLLTSIPGIVIGTISGIRRCHDRDRSGWFLLLSFIPIIGWIWLFVELGFLKGTDGPNRFGPDPVS